jgi:hypothetical protein
MGAGGRNASGRVVRRRLHPAGGLGVASLWRRATGRSVIRCALAASLWALALPLAPAQAASGHELLSSLSEAPLGSAMGEPDAVAVEQSTGRAFVADPGRGVIDVFGSSGSYETQFGAGHLGAVAIAVDEETHDVYVAEAFGDAVFVFKPDGKGGYEELSEWLGRNAPEKEFGQVTGVAIDNSKSLSDPHAGDVYVAGALNNAVYVFRPKGEGAEEKQEGAFLSTLSGTKLQEPNGVAVDSATGTVYVADSVKGAVDIYSSAGSFEKKLTGASSPEGAFFGPEEEEGNVTAVAIDEATGELYVAEAERHVVSQFNGAGEWIGWITSTPTGALEEPRGVAIAPSGEVYLADAVAHLVDIFGPDVLVADAKTNAPSKVTKTTAMLNGVVNGEGKVATYHFQWGTTTAYGSQTPTQSAGTGEQKVKAELSGLKAGTTYHFRLVSENENGMNVGADREFTTLPAVEALSTGPVANLMPTSATLTGSLTPNSEKEPLGLDAHYYFQYVRYVKERTESTTVCDPEPQASPEPCTDVPAPPGTDAGAGTQAVEAKTDLPGLQPNTSYHYRLIATNSLGTTTGEDEHFTTSGPPRITSEATTGIEHYGATIHARVDPDELESEYHFEYGESTSYGTEVPLGGAKIPAGEVPVAESATLSGLKIGTTYHFRVVASNGAGITFGPDQTFTTIPPALIESESVAQVSSTGATLQTQVNPLGHDTHFYFQYGSESCEANPASCTNVPVPPGSDLGSSETGQPASVRLQELNPSTTYHYRVLASNSLGTAEGAERTFTTQPPAEPFALADNRAWEMVSPPDKHGAGIEAITREGGVIQAAEEGNSITYVADGPITEEVQGNRSPEMQQVLSTRTPAGWSSQDIATPNESGSGVTPGKAPEYQLFSTDLSLALVAPFGTTARSEPPLAPEARQKTIYLRNDQSGAYLPLVTEANVPAGTEFGHQLEFLSATPDLSHVVLQSNVALTPAPSAPGLYEWAAGKLALLSVLPTGAPAPTPRLGFGGGITPLTRDANHAISNDGSRVIWGELEENSGVGHLYMRDSATGETIQLDTAQGVPEPEGSGAARFQTASSDGSRVFFTDKQRLTADSTAEPAQGAGKADLYECEVAEVAGKLACHIKDLTVDSHEGEHAAVQGLPLGSSEDGASVYLLAHGVLVENENGNGEVAQAEKDNLYLLHFSGTRWTTTFIAVLSGEDRPEWEGNEHSDLAFTTARVSPSGRYLAFMSAASLTGYDNIDQNSGKADEEVYLYDSASARLSCASCNPTGARPSGVLDTLNAGEGLGLLVDRRQIWNGRWLAGSIPGWTSLDLVHALYQSRYLSDSGRLFFNSLDHLVHQATDGKENVYEYEPAGVGSCESRTGGCVSLISLGSSGRESAFLDASASGNDVFFLTASQLVPQDIDGAFDVYDARVCTPASPCLSPPQPAPAGCGTADACRPASPSQQAPAGPPPTATLSGQGNVAQAQNLGAKAGQPKQLSRAQKLARALKACRKLRGKKRRAACERKARKAYGAKSKAKRSSRRARARTR